MKNYIIVLLFCTSSIFFLASCGGGSGDENSNSNSKNLTELLKTDDYGIATDIINLDLNNDGYEDLIIFKTRDNPFYSGLSIQALINKGDRTFIDESNKYFSSIGDDWHWIDKAYLVDLNGDGQLDIVGHTDSSFSLTLPPLIRIDSGEFEITTNQTILDNMGAIVPIDTDADGDIDILVRDILNFGDETEQFHQWSLLENITTPGNVLSFKSNGVVTENPYKGLNNGSFVYSPIIIDINNDGYQDLIYGGPKWENSGFIDERTLLNVYINSTQNTFLEGSSQVFAANVPSFTHVREMIAADFNNDGYKSIVVANTGYDWEPYPGQNNSILKNNGMGNLLESLGTSTTHNYQGFTHSSDIGDIDNDGDLDIVYTDILGDDVKDSKKVRILKNDGSGNFSFTSSYSLNSNGWTSTKLVDLDNDGYLDLVLGSINSESKSIIVWNDGSGNF